MKEAEDYDGIMSLEITFATGKEIDDLGEWLMEEKDPICLHEISVYIVEEGTRMYVGIENLEMNEMIKKVAYDVCTDHAKMKVHGCIFNFDTEIVEGYECEGGGYIDS